MQQKKAPKYIATQTYPELDPTLRHLPYGQSKYGSLKHDYPQHWESFRNIHDRSQRNGVEVEHHFRRNFQGLWNFIEHVGPIPADIHSPTIGRIDHSRGYIRHNVRWEERGDNSREATDRRFLVQRHERLRILLAASLDLAWFGTAHLKSTTLSAWWKLIDEPCRSDNVPIILATLADTFKGRFAWEVAKPGRGRRATVFTIRIDPALIKELEASALDSSDHSVDALNQTPALAVAV